MIPACSSPRPSSRAEQIIPSDTRPYVLRAVIANPPGSTAPGSATTTRSPAAKLRAPQMIPRGPDPTSTWHQRIVLPLLAVNSSTSSTRPTSTGPTRSAPTSSISSTSTPSRTSPAAISRDVSDGGSATCSRSQDSGSRTSQTSVPNGSMNRTSPSNTSRMSSTSCRASSVRSMPMPNAKPL
jgi:hypothetical protein